MFSFIMLPKKMLVYSQLKSDTYLKTSNIYNILLVFIF